MTNVAPTWQWLWWAHWEQPGGQGTEIAVSLARFTKALNRRRR